MEKISCNELQCYFQSKICCSRPEEYNLNGDEEKETGQTKTRKPGGWKAMPYILGNETFERLASMGMLANFMLFLLTQFHMDQVMASNVINVWSGVTSFFPLIGAYISDSYLGKFKTIAFATFAAFMGMVTMTLIVWFPALHPPVCMSQSNQCMGPTKSQFGVLVLALVLLSIGSAGIRPCSIPFGVDQFDSRTEEGQRGINSFFNWYYTSFTVVIIIALTLVVYIQDSVSWVLGFAILATLMLCSIVLFFLGTRVYVHVKPRGSVFTGIAQAAVAAYKKRKLGLPDWDCVRSGYYDPPLKGDVVMKLPFTNQFRFLNKAAVIMDGDVLTDGSNANPWRLCSIQVVEETKCLLGVIPIWASGILCFTATAQQGTFTISQAMKMDRRLGKNFLVPPGSLFTISMVTVGIWVPIYDRFVVPYLRKVTRLEGGISLLQRMGIGIVFSILSMVVAGFIERMRRASALAHGGPSGMAPISVFWLAPQLILMGFSEAFNIIGQIEFYNKEFPENMSSLANSLFSCTMAGASYISAIMVSVIHNTTARGGHLDWLTKDINAGRVENFYFLIAGVVVLDMGYFVWVARGYQYKSKYRIDDEGCGLGVELNTVSTQ